MPNYFSYNELACKDDCGFDAISKKTLDCANAVREFLGYPVKASSVCRCVDYNSKIVVRDGKKVRLGAIRSYHLPRKVLDAVTVSGGKITRPKTGMASLSMDLHIRKKDRERVFDFIRKHFPEISIGRYDYGMHIDSGYQHGYRKKPVIWGKAF